MLLKPWNPTHCKGNFWSFAVLVICFSSKNSLFFTILVFRKWTPESFRKFGKVNGTHYRKLSCEDGVILSNTFPCYVLICESTWVGLKPPWRTNAPYFQCFLMHLIMVMQAYFVFVFFFYQHHITYSTTCKEMNLDFCKGFILCILVNAHNIGLLYDIKYYIFYFRHLCNLQFVNELVNCHYNYMWVALVGKTPWFQPTNCTMFEWADKFSLKCVCGWVAKAPWFPI